MVSSELLYRESIVRSLEYTRGIAMGGHGINNMGCADDTALVTENEHDLQNLMVAAVVHSKMLGL